MRGIRGRFDPYFILSAEAFPNPRIAGRNDKNPRALKRDAGISTLGGVTRIRTGDEGFADPCLTTWL